MSDPAAGPAKTVVIALGGNEVVITRPELLAEALIGKRCTRIVQ